MDLVLATYKGLAALDPHDQLLIPALQRQGLVAAPVRWDDALFDWSVPKLTLIRSTWDYHHRLPEFLKWADRVQSVGHLANAAPVVRWNSHKQYLRELAAKGVPVLDTEWLEHRSAVDLPALMGKRGWNKVVVKAAVSAGALDVLIVERSNAASQQPKLQSILAKSDALVQPFLPHLHEFGEASAIFFDGQFAYGIHRPAGILAPGVVPATTRALTLSPAQRELAEQAFAACPPGSLYARVDIAEDTRGTLRVMEVEMIEPALYFGLVPEAADLLARAIAKRVTENSHSR